MARMRHATTISMITFLGLLEQVAAFPFLYDGLAMCTIPDKGFDGHMAPTENPAITFELMDATGAAVTTWDAGAVYTLTVGPYATAPTNAWIHASEGTLEPVDAMHRPATACDSAVYSSAPVVGPHVVTWTAPADDSVCVTVSTAQATGATAGYDAGLVSLPGATATPCALPMLEVSTEPPHMEGAVVEGAVVEGFAPGSGEPMPAAAPVEGAAVEGAILAPADAPELAAPLAAAPGVTSRAAAFPAAAAFPTAATFPMAATPTAARPTAAGPAAAVPTAASPTAADSAAAAPAAAEGTVESAGALSSAAWASAAAVAVMGALAVA